MVAAFGSSRRESNTHDWIYGTDQCSCPADLKVTKRSWYGWAHSASESAMKKMRDVAVDSYAKQRHRQVVDKRCADIAKGITI